MDINMPDMDGIAATEQLSAEVPTAAVVMMSVQGEADYLRRSMLAGAREFLVKPFSSDELTASIRQVYAREREKQSAGSPSRRPRPRPPAHGAAAEREPGEPGQVVAVFSPKGGVGRTTSRSTSPSPPPPSSASRSCLVDGSFQFGDVGVLLNLNPKNKSIADLVPELEAGELESIDTFVINHSAGIRVLLAPPSPGDGRADHAGRRQAGPRGAAHATTTSSSSTARRRSTTRPWPSSTRPTSILTMLTLEITSIKNMRLFLEVADQLGYEHGKVRLVLNRADSALGIRVADVEHSIGRKVDHTIVSDGRSVVYALNRGVPFFLSQSGGAGLPGHPAAGPVGGRRASAPVGSRRCRKKAAQKKSLFAWR